MPVKTGAVAGRRRLRFSSLEELERDADQITSRPARTLGNWTVAQNLDHLSKAIQAGFEGPEVQAPWFVRSIIGPLIRGRMLSKGMPAGFNLPKELSHFMPGEDPSVQASLQSYKSWLARLKAECPRMKHPAFGNLSHADWIRLHLRHGELHLSFIVPTET